MSMALAKDAPQDKEPPVEAPQKEKETDAPQDSPLVEAEKPKGAAPHAIPADVTYKELRADLGSGGFVPPVPRDRKGVIYLELNRRVSKEVVLSIALKVKESEPFLRKVYFFLPYMRAVPDSNSWAMAYVRAPELAPELDRKVVMRGLTEEEAKSLTREVDEREVIGSWLEDWPGELGGFRITFIREGDRVFRERKYIRPFTAGDLALFRRLGLEVKG
jgi:hypothetical protein